MPGAMEVRSASPPRAARVRHGRTLSGRPQAARTLPSPHAGPRAQTSRLMPPPPA